MSLTGERLGLMSTTVWDPERYERQPLPHERWGGGVIARACLEAGDSLVDAGCGTGRDAELALDQLVALADEHGVAPGTVTLLDADAGMVTAALRRFAGWPDSLRPVILQANLLDPWPVFEPAEVIISVAALHWIGDHASVFRQAAAIGAERARLHVECGGAGNIEGLVAAATRVRLPMPTWNFASVDDTVEALRASGWTPREVWLHPDPLVLPDEATFRDFLESVVFHDATESQLDGLMAACAETVVDYVRLNIDAERSYDGPSGRARSVA